MLYLLSLAKCIPSEIPQLFWDAFLVIMLKSTISYKQMPDVYTCRCLCFIQRVIANVIFHQLYFYQYSSNILLTKYSSDALASSININPIYKTWHSLKYHIDKNFGSKKHWHNCICRIIGEKTLANPTTSLFILLHTQPRDNQVVRCRAKSIAGSRFPSISRYFYAKYLSCYILTLVFQLSVLTIS